MSQDYTPDVKAREFPLAARVLANSPLDWVAYLAALTMHGEIVAMLGGLTHLARHISYLPKNIIKELLGIDVPPTDGTQPSTTRARQAHTLRQIFDKYPLAAHFVLNAIAVLVVDAYERRQGQVTDEEAADIEEALNHIARRHGVPAGEKLLQDRYLAYFVEVKRLKNDRLFTGEVGAEAFWKVVASPEILELMGVQATADTVQAIMQLTTNGVHDLKLTTPYMAAGARLRDQLPSTGATQSE